MDKNSSFKLDAPGLNPVHGYNFSFSLSSLADLTSTGSSYHCRLYTLIGSWVELFNQSTALLHTTNARNFEKKWIIGAVEIFDLHQVQLFTLVLNTKLRVFPTFLLNVKANGPWALLGKWRERSTQFSYVTKEDRVTAERFVKVYQKPWRDPIAPLQRFVSGPLTITVTSLYLRNKMKRNSLIYFGGFLSRKQR